MASPARAGALRRHRAGSMADAELDAATVNAYVLYKAFDVSSEGEYRRLVVARRDAGDAWAIELSAQVQRVTAQIKGVQRQVAVLAEHGRERLQAHCQEVLAHANPPCRTRPGWGTCTLSGMRGRDCLDLVRQGKSPAPLLVHARFRHFMLMLWLTVKFENVCKALARAWLRRLDGAVARETPVNALCQRFQAEHADDPALHLLLRHALAHVAASLRAAVA
jgi:hypothetical protein